MSPRPRRRSAASHHVEWLQLVDVNGPFLSLSVLTETFPQGLDAVEPELAELLRNAYSEWTTNQELRHPDVAIHTAFLRFVLTEILEYPSEFIADTQELGDQFVAQLPEHGVSLRPDLAIRRSGEPPKLLVSTYAAGVQLQKPYEDRHFHASPAERMRLLLRQTDVRSGLVTNGEEWLLVHVPTDRTATFVTWYANLLIEERSTLRALRSLLGTRRLFGVDDPETLDGLFERSRDDEREVTDQLGLQTRRAVELLVSAFDYADRDASGKLLEDVPEYRLYEATVAVVMRIIFLLAAEARSLFPDDGPWANSYAITPLRAQLEELADKGTLEALDRRFDAWPRLLATFRAVHDGVEHSRVRMPGYGGGLFDPNRYPFLEGADGIVPRISNRAVLHILDALQTLEVDVPGGRERRPLSFRALGVEQIGHVYEGLLDHTAIRADAPALGLTGTKKKEPEIPLAELEERQTRGEDTFLEFLAEQTGRSHPALKKGLGAEADPIRIAHLREACDHDGDLVDRVLPFLGLVRDDVFGLPMVFCAGAVYVTESSERRATGTHYTPPSLTEPIVQYALEPVVYRGPAEGKAREEWELKRPSELLELKVADIAMGSAAFLVAACRYLATRLVESWERFPDEVPADAGVDLEEREFTARRVIAERCLYGVDINALAVEIAKVSMWLTTLRRDRPFTFLDHALRCGDSLLGLTNLDQLEALTLRPEEAESILLEPARDAIRATLAEVREVRERIEASDALDLREAEEKAAALARADRHGMALCVVGDLVVGTALEEAAGKSSARTTVEASADEIRRALLAPSETQRDELLARVETRAGDALMMGRAPGSPDPPRPFHWALEFPEVFQRDEPGFDVIVGNPPFLGGTRISSELGRSYREYLVEQIAYSSRGSADLIVYFTLRVVGLLRESGSSGTIATTTVAEGDSREVGLHRLLSDSCVVSRAETRKRWPGEANLLVSVVWLQRRNWTAEVLLNGDRVVAISDRLAAEEKLPPLHKLGENKVVSFNGSKVDSGFVLQRAEAVDLLARKPGYADVIKPFLIGEDLNRRPQQDPSRYAITFHTWPMERAELYPECLEIVRQRVKPARDRNKRKVRREKWWLHSEPTPGLYKALLGLEQVAVTSVVTKYLAFTLVSIGMVFSHRVIVVPSDDPALVGILNSSFVDAWVRMLSGTLGATLNFTPSDSLDYLPLPTDMRGSGDFGSKHLSLRQAAMRHRGIGLTSVLNLVHENVAIDDSDIAALRTSIRNLDRAVADAYGWTDLELDHDFRETPLGLRYTISDVVKTEALDRLLELNHARYAEEVAQGLHAGKGKSGSRKRAKPHQSGGQLEL